MAWIDVDRVETLLQTDLSSDDWIGGLIDHAQSLAEGEVGPQTEPVEGDFDDAADFGKAVARWGALRAVLAQIVARMWQSGQSAQQNPAGFQSETTGPFTFQDPSAGTAGLGLTNREAAALRKAVGRSGLWVQPTTRGDRLETAPIHNDIEDATDPIDTLAAAQIDVRR